MKTFIKNLFKKKDKAQTVAKGALLVTLGLVGTSMDLNGFGTVIQDNNFMNSFNIKTVVKQELPTTDIEILEMKAKLKAAKENREGSKLGFQVKEQTFNVEGKEYNVKKRQGIKKPQLKLRN